MDYDRRSAVSSFYGGRKNSLDALNNADYPLTSQPGRVRQDSASSFYNPNGPSRSSAEMLRQQPSAGYNRMSYFDAGREEPVKGVHDEEEAAGLKDDGFDIYADFNNAGPRYAPSSFINQDAAYHQVPSPSLKMDEEVNNGGKVEMVTVPALGPEWKKSELRNMTKRGKREDAADARARKWKEWRRGERGLCGRYFTRKFSIWFLFGVIVAIGLILTFTVPRVPGFEFNSNTPLIPATGSFNKSIPVEFLRFPANFSFPAFADLQLDTGSNFLPLTFNKIHADVFDLNTGQQVGYGNMGHMTVPAKAFPIINVPLNFTYIATNDTDQTWVNWYNACKNKGTYADGKRPAIQFRLVLDFAIAGLIGNHATSTQVTDAPCPIELPINSV